MVFYSGLWTARLFDHNVEDSDDDERERNRRANEQTIKRKNTTNTNNNTNTSHLQNPFAWETLMNHNDYGSRDDRLFNSNVTKEEKNDDDADEDEKRKVSWKHRKFLAVDMETGKGVPQDNNNNNIGQDVYNNNNNYQGNKDTHLEGNDVNNCSNFTYDDDNQSQSTSGTLNSQDTRAQQDLPGLTATFVSVDNRPILVNCAWYLAIYAGISVVAYSFVFEQWPIIDSVYFAVATFTTCGYSDTEPSTAQGQIFTIIFAIYGVIILGVFIGIFGNMVSQAQTKTMKKFQRKKQKQMLRTMFPTSIMIGDQNDKTDNNNNTAVDNNNNNTADTEGIDDDDHSSTTQRPSPPVETTGFWQEHISLADDIFKVLRAEFPSIALVAVMAIFLGWREQWTWTSTLYFSVMAATTTGYGDYTPTNQIDKVYCMVFLPLAVAVFGEVLGRIATVYIQRQQRQAEYKFLNRSMTLCDMRKMDRDDDGKVDKFDFVAFLLVALQKVDRATIDELSEVFDSLDKNGNGTLEAEDLIDLAEEHYLPTVERVKRHQRKVSMAGADFSMPMIFRRDSEILRGFLSPSQQQPGQSEMDKSQNRHKRSHTVL